MFSLKIKQSDSIQRLRVSARPPIKRLDSVTIGLSRLRRSADSKRFHNCSSQIPPKIPNHAIGLLYQSEHPHVRIGGLACERCRAGLLHATAAIDPARLRADAHLASGCRQASATVLRTENPRRQRQRRQRRFAGGCAEALLDSAVFR